jgi:hypothetical protein
VDLYEPGSGSQVHDFNGGLLASGLFWTLPVPPGAIRVSADGRRAVLHLTDFPVVDSFSFGSPIATPATVSLRVEWTATGPFVERGSGKDVAPTSDAAFRGRFAPAVSTATFAGSELGFSFRAHRGVTTAGGGYAQMGWHRNGVFLTG